MIFLFHSMNLPKAQVTLRILHRLLLEIMNDLLTQMQDETTPLADAVKLYAEAASLIQYCNKTLETAKLKIEEIDASLLAAQEEPQ